MKKSAFILLAMTLMLMPAGCGASEKAQEKAAEKALEEMMGGDVQVDIEGDQYTYEDKDGNKMAFGGTEWPTDEAAAFIPKFDQGTVAACTVMANIYLIEVEDVEQADYDSYLQAVKDAGFTKSAFSLDETDTEGYYQYQAGDANGNSMILSYEAEAKTLQITGTVAAEE